MRNSCLGDNFAPVKNLKIMIMYRLTVILLFICCHIVVSAQEDSIRKMVFNGAVTVELNYGNNASDGNVTSKIDLPHLILNGDLHWGKGWSIISVFEYERFYEDGVWGNDFNNNFCTNKLYITKQFSDEIHIKAGIIETPVGITNSEGPALTIYDPESESGILPLKWHETGISFYGNKGKFGYQLSALAYINNLFHRTEMLGGAARLDYYPIEPLRIGVSGYYGKSCHGMINRGRPEFMDDDNALAYWSMDFDYQQRGLLVDGSVIYCSDSNAKSVGIEAGFDILTLCNSYMQLIPFVRYDGLWGKTFQGKTKYTAGVNFSPFKNLILKSEYGIRCLNDGSTERMLDFCAGYTICF